MKTRLSSTLSFAMSIAMAASILIGQEVPKPKPVTPPAVVPGTKPPAKPGFLPPAQDETLSNRATPAAEKIAGEGQDAAVQPFIEEDTLAVARIDAAEIDPAKYQQWINTAIDGGKLNGEPAKEARDLSAEQFKQAADWLQKFRAAGGSRVYVVFSLMDVPSRPPFLVMPLATSSDGKGLINLFASLGGATTQPASQQMTAEKIGDCVVAGLPATINRFKSSTSNKRRPEVSAALAAGNGPIRFALVPGEGPRQMLEAASPSLPEELGGFPSKVVSQGLSWLSASMSAPPQVSLQVIIQAKDAAAAKDLQQLAVKALAVLRENAKQWNLPFDADALAALLTPKVEADRVIASADADHTRQFAANILVPALMASRQRAMSITSMSNMRQLLLGCIMYASDHQNQWPDSLVQLEKSLGKESLAQLMTNPSRPQQNPAYVYHKPVGANATAPSTVVLYEAHDAWPGTVAVGFADGHVEMINNPAAFDRAMGAGGK